MEELTIRTTVQPSEINPKAFMGSKWQHMESEAGASILVRYAQKQGNWNPIPKKELDKFAKEDFWFNKLVYGDIIVITTKTLKLKKLKEPLLEKKFINASEYFSLTEEVVETIDFKNPMVHFTDNFINEVHRLTLKAKR